MANRREKPKIPGLLEQARRLNAKRKVTETKGLMASALDVLDLKFRKFRGQATAEELSTLDDISQEATTLAQAAERKVDAAVEKKSRFKVTSAVKQENHPDHVTKGTPCEDVAVQDDQRQIYAVFDGIGSYGDGDKAAHDAAQVIKAELDALPSDATVDEIAVMLRAAFKKAGEAIRTAPYNLSRPPNRRAGTTGVAVTVHEGSDGRRTAVIAHAGDSRVYVRKATGELRPLTTDHSYFKNFADQGLLDQADFKKLSDRFANTINPDTELTDPTVYFQAQDFRDGKTKHWTERLLYDACNVVANYVTDQAEPEISQYELEDGDQLLLTSDGIHDLVPDARISSAFDVHTDADEIAERLLADSKAGIRKGPQNKTDDDRTALVVQWEDVLKTEVQAHVERYKQQVANGEVLTTPNIPVDQTAFEQLMTAGHPGLREAFQRSYHQIDEPEWRAAGAGSWIETMQMHRIFESRQFDRFSGTVDAKQAATVYLGSLDRFQRAELINEIVQFVEQRLEAGVNVTDLWTGIDPHLDQKLRDELSIPDDATLRERRLGQHLQEWREAIMHEKPVVKDSADAVEALVQIGDEMRAAGLEDDLMAFVVRCTARFPDMVAVFELAGIDTAGTIPRDVRSETLALDRVVEMKRQLLYEAQLKAQDQLGVLQGNLAEQLAAVQFTEAGAIQAESELVNRLNHLINQILNTEGGVQLADIAADPRAQELAKAMAITIDAVAETIVTYQEVLKERAAQRERSERKLGTQLAKAGMYLAGGAALTATGIVAPPVALGIIASARLTDRLFGHRSQLKKQATYLTETLTKIKTQHADRQLAVDEIAASLAARKREQFTVARAVGSRAVYGQLLEQFRDQYCLTEYANTNEALNRYNDAVRDNRPEADQQSFFTEYLKQEATYKEAMEPYHRAADAYAALMMIDEEMTGVGERQAQQAATWVEKHPKIAALLGYRGELISEKVTSMAAFTAMGIAAREWLPVRVALSAFAGARAGEALMTWQLQREAAAERSAALHRLTTDTLNKVDLTQPDAAADAVANLRPAVAEARQKLADAKFRRQQPKRYEELFQLVTRFEQLQAAMNAQQAITSMAVELRQLHRVVERSETRQTKNVWRRRLVALSTGLAAGVASAALGSNVDDWLDRFKTEQPLSVSGAQGWLANLKGLFSREDVAPVDVTPPAAPPLTVEPTPEQITPAPAAEPTPSPTPEPAEQPTPAPVTEAAPASPTASAVETPAVAPAGAKIVGEGQGVSHALRGQVGRGELNQLLHDTKVTLNGHEVSLANTGVTDAGKLQIGVSEVGGHTVVEFYDATTHQKISPEHIDDYLYERGVAPAPAVEAPAAAATPEPSISDLEGSADTAGEPVTVDTTPTGFAIRAPLASETFEQYQADVLREYVASHPDYGELASLSDEELADRPELGRMQDDVADRYRAELDQPPAPEVAVAGATTESGEPAVVSSTGEALVNEHGRLTAGGMKELTLAEHISSSGEPENFQTFKKEIVELLAAAKQDRIATTNNLVFEERGGELYVDVKGGGRDAYLVDEDLYGHLMATYRTMVEPHHGGQFTKEIFYLALDKADVPHDLHNFELDQVNLNLFLEKGSPVPYAKFQTELTEFMKDHDLAKFHGQNGLVFYRENDQLSVDVEGGLQRQYPLTGELYQALMARYQDLGYDYHEKFDVTQFEYVLKQVEEKK